MRDLVDSVANAERVDTRLQLEIELLAHLLLSLLDLRLHEVAGFSLEAGFNLLADLLALLLLDLGSLVLLLDIFQFLLQLLLSNLLLCHANLILLDLLGNLILLGEAANLQMTTAATCLQVQGNFLEDWVDWQYWLLSIWTEQVVARQVILVEDFVFPA